MTTPNNNVLTPTLGPAHGNMYFAIASGDVARTRVVLEHRRAQGKQHEWDGAGPSEQTDQPVVGNWPLHFALMNCKANLAAMATLLLEFGADPNGTVLTSPGTPLALALTHGLEAGVVLALLRGGADVNGDADGRQIPLHWCARSANLETCRFLLENGADWRKQDRQHETAEEVAGFFHGSGAPITRMLRAVREADELGAGQENSWTTTSGTTSRNDEVIPDDITIDEHPIPHDEESADTRRGKPRML